MQPLAGVLGNSPEIAAVRDMVGRLLRPPSAARRLPPVLIQGETGTGKGLLARAIHQASARAAGPFVVLNCAAIPETLLEAELFGFERGAFTDARQAKLGLFQAAHRGALFLDEVGLMPEGLQAKLLTVLEEQAVRRLGRTRPEPVDVWVLAATSVDLAAARRAGRFHEALYHRLAVLTVRLPPLRARGADVLLLAEHFLARACADYALPPKMLADDARAALLAYHWPGNVRELANVIERATLLAEGRVMTAASLELPPEASTEPRLTPPAGAGRPPDAAIGRQEPDRLLEALAEAGGNLSRAAARLGLPRNTFRYRIEKHGLRQPVAPPRRRPAAAARAPGSSTVVPDAGLAPATGGWTRRRLTLLRAEVRPAEGGAAATDARGWLALVAELGEKARSFGARLEALSPTGLVAVFGVEPGEGATRRAALAALALQTTVARGQPDASPPVTLAVGLHVEPLLVGDGGGAPVLDLDAGHEAWARLARLLAHAPPGAVVVTEAAARLLPRGFELAPQAPVEGVPGPVARLVGRQPAAPGPRERLAPFIGRDQELALLGSRVAAALRGYGQVVGLVGEPGIGKSRLLVEVRARLAGQPIRWLEGRCLAHGRAVPYLPVLDLLRQQCGLAETDAPARVAEKARHALQALGLAAEQIPYLLRLLGIAAETEPLARLSPEAIKSRTFDTLRQLTLQASRAQPLVVVIEDLQWLDQTSEEYLTGLVESLAGAPLLLLVTYRPDYRPPWLATSYATQLALPPLSPEESRWVVQAVWPRAPLPDAIARTVLERADGNPFFLEELARAVADPGHAGSADAVPETIQEVLLARIDRLADDPRRLLQTAAILGREFSSRLLETLWDRPGGVERHLRELVRLEFLAEQPGGEEAGYRFKHALTQEVTYASLLPAHRQALHAAAGRALEALYAERLEEAADRLAYHYARSAEADKALAYLVHVAEKAARGFAHVEALAALQEALGHVEQLPGEDRDRRRLDVSLRLAHSLYFLGRFQESFDLLLRQQERVERLEDPRLAGPYYFILGRGYNFLGEHDKAVLNARRALEAARRCGDDTSRGKACYVLAVEAHWAGRPQEGIARARQAVALLERTPEPFWLAQAYRALGFNYYLVGDFEQALEGESRAHAIGEATGDPQLQSHTLWTTGWIEATRGEWAVGIDACRRGLDRAPDPSTAAFALGYLGLAYLEQGDAAAAIPLLEQSVLRLGELGFRRSQGRFTTFLADACRAGGQLGRAHELARRGLEIAGDTRCRPGIGWAQRVLGRIARAGGSLADAERHLTEALETFAAIGARFEVGRTHLDLAEMAGPHAASDAAARHVMEARRLFQGLHAPRYLERTEQLAHVLDERGA